jgi:hypothetical protein
MPSAAAKPLLTAAPNAPTASAKPASQPTAAPRQCGFTVGDVLWVWCGRGYRPGTVVGATRKGLLKVRIQNATKRDQLMEVDPGRVTPVQEHQHVEHSPAPAERPTGS